MKSIHGGDIYRNNITLDYSVNCNPYGIPQDVRQALYHAVEHCHEYPDMESDMLAKAVSRMLQVPEDYLLFGNGASELFMGIVHALKPKKALLPVPSFYGYQHALTAVDCEIQYCNLSQEAGFMPNEELLHSLTEDIDLLFLANPNNPTGQRMEKAFLKKLLTDCRKKKIHVILDECFIEFCGEECSMIEFAEEFENLILIRAFTKIYAIPGVRLGYLITGNQPLLTKIHKQLPEWNVSVLAQQAGLACTKQQEYLMQSIKQLRKERAFLTEGLKKLGFKVYPGEANFILFYSELPLYDGLLARGILIRDCSNYKGLIQGYYRIAVKQREDNEHLLEAMKECMEGNR